MESYENNTLDEIKDMCRGQGIRCAGKRETLIRKLNEARERNAAAAAIEEMRFKVYVRLLMGRVITIYCDKTITIEQFVALAAQEIGCAPEKLILFLYCNDPPQLGDLMFGGPETVLSGPMTGKKLTAGTLEENGVFNGSSIHAHMRLR